MIVYIAGPKPRRIHVGMLGWPRLAALCGADEHRGHDGGWRAVTGWPRADFESMPLCEHCRVAAGVIANLVVQQDLRCARAAR